MIAGTDSSRPARLEDLITPDLAARLDRLDVFSRKLLAGKMPGERRSKRRGRSVEFDDFRTYVAGDDLRHIDWNIYARFERLFIKLFREEEDLALDLFVDCSGSMDAGKPNKLVFVAQLGLALAYVGLVNQNRVSVTLAGAAEGRGPGRLRSLAPMRGRRNLSRIASELLAEIRQRREGGADLNEGLRAFAKRRTGRGLTVVLSDFLIPQLPAAGLNALAGGDAGTFDVYCLQTVAPGEIDPSTESESGLVGDLRLTDTETGRAVETTISNALLAKYRAAFESQRESLRRMSMSRGVAYFLVSTATPVDQLVLGSLRRGGMLR